MLAEWLLGKILYPIFRVQSEFYETLGISDEYNLPENYGLGFIYENILDSIWKIITTIFTSLSGCGWVVHPSGALSLFAAIIFTVIVFIVSVCADSYMLTKIAEQNQKNTRKSYGWLFVWIFGLWRIFLPDIFVIGVTLAFWTNMKMSKREIWKMNLIIQGIRAFLFIAFAIYGILYYWE